MKGIFLILCLGPILVGCSGGGPLYHLEKGLSSGATSVAGGVNSVQKGGQKLEKAWNGEEYKNPNEKAAEGGFTSSYTELDNELIHEKLQETTLISYISTAEKEIWLKEVRLNEKLADDTPSGIEYALINAYKRGVKIKLFTTHTDDPGVKRILRKGGYVELYPARGINFLLPREARYAIFDNKEVLSMGDKHSDRMYKIRYRPDLYAKDWKTSIQKSENMLKNPLLYK